MKTVRVLLIAAVVVTAITSYSQTVVYAGTNRAFGVCWGGSNLYETYVCALNKCVSEGGENPQRILSYAGKGFGAIVRASNGAIGCSAGLRTAQEAINKAIEW